MPRIKECTSNQDNISSCSDNEPDHLTESLDFEIESSHHPSSKHRGRKRYHDGRDINDKRSYHKSHRKSRRYAKENESRSSSDGDDPLKKKEYHKKSKKSTRSTSRSKSRKNKRRKKTHQSDSHSSCEYHTSSDCEHDFDSSTERLKLKVDHQRIVESKHVSKDEAKNTAKHLKNKRHSSKHLKSKHLSIKHKHYKHLKHHRNEKRHRKAHHEIKSLHIDKKHQDKVCKLHHEAKCVDSSDEFEKHHLTADSSDSSSESNEDDQVERLDIQGKRQTNSHTIDRQSNHQYPKSPVGLKGKTEAKEGNVSVLDYNFDFTKYKYSIGKIFFRDTFFSQIAQRGTTDHDDFWAFIKKFQEFQKKKAEKSQGDQVEMATNTSSNSFGLPQKYDVQYKINLSFVSKEFEDILTKNRLIDHHIEKELTRARILQFHSILLHFLDFHQKQKFQKLHKIRRDQRNLPIYQYKNKIVDMLKLHQVIVVAGDTGCGKSTQVPQYLLEAGFEKVACTQPRRIACISLSKRVGYETLNEYGSQVAYQVRFEKSKTAATKILFLTEGLLLRQMCSDPLLEMYNVVVIDEVHERHIYTDFLLGVLKCVLRQRTDLKLVLMSATININLFSSYFHNAPIVKVPGRLYPIEMEFCPLTKGDLDTRRLDPTPYLRIMQRIDHKYPPTERGDLLIFLSGVSEIMSVVQAAKAYAQQMKRWIVLPLHSGLSMSEQDKVFDVAPEGVRKCIVSTNIAETSVTIDGVRFIVDSGKVKEMSYDTKFKMRKLQEFWISRASSEQRKGRAGRTGPGVCFRLYDESEYNNFDEYSTPEIQRVPLDSLILQMISMGLPDARKFPFIEPPSMSSLEESILFLKDQGALASDESLTPIGQMLSMLPVDVVIGKMLIMGSIFNMIDPVLSVTAAMSVQSPFTNNAYTDHEAMTVRKPLESDHGDPFTLLNAFDEWIQVKAQGLGTNKWCKRRALEEQRFYEMTKLKRQFKDLLRDHHLLDGGEDQQKYLTSEERRAKHGERKRLNQLRREKMREGKRRKVLTMEDEEYKISDEDDGKGGDDIKDLEFRLSNDLNQLQETANKSRSFTLRDINLMKIILCSGLYPQVAIADDCNTYKRDSEQAFHTKNKPFILLHPTSIFATQPDLLTPKDADGRRPQPSELKGLLSSKHELLSYVSLLETNNKPYLVNTMRVPALQTVTLFSNCIDTNGDCTRLICDSWLEIKFAKVEMAEMVVSSIIQLRSTWHNLLRVRLQDTFEGIEEERRVSPRARQLERILASKLTEFLNTDVVYSMRRVLPAEIQRAYVGPGNGGGASDLFSGVVAGQHTAKENPVKGGVFVTDYLTFNCLVDEESASIWGEFTANMQRHWLCPQCGQSMVISVLERLQHEAMCSSEDGPGVKAQEARGNEEEHQASLNPLRKPYFCPECKESLSLTTTEILKHRKSHTL